MGREREEGKKIQESAPDMLYNIPMNAAMAAAPKMEAPAILMLAPTPSNWAGGLGLGLGILLLTGTPGMTEVAMPGTPVLSGPMDDGTYTVVVTLVLQEVDDTGGTYTVFVTLGVQVHEPFDLVHVVE